MPPPRSRSFAERSHAARAEQNRGKAKPSRGIYKRLRTACQRKVTSLWRVTSNPLVDPCGEGKTERALSLLLAFCSEQGLLLAKSSTPLRSAQDDTKGKIFDQRQSSPTPSVIFLRKCHRLAAARSRRGSDTTPWCHSLPRRRFATS